MMDLPSGWTATTLCTVADWSSGGTPSRKRAEFFGGDIPWVKTGELTKKYVCETEETLTELGVKSSSAKVFPRGSVGIAMYGATIGKVSIWGIDASTNQACAVARPINGVVSSEFLYHFLRSEKDALVREAKGGAQPNISQGLLKAWPFPLPPFNEQRRIVARLEALFDEIDNGVESLHDAKRAVELYRQSLLKSAFEGRLTADWRAKNPDKLDSPEVLLAHIREEHEKRYGIAVDDWKRAVAEWKAEGMKDKRPSKPYQASGLLLVPPEEAALLPQLPPEWRYTKLANLGELARGRSRHRPRNDQRLFGGPYPFIQTGEVKAAGRSITEYRTTYSELGLAQSKLWPEGTLCITIAANIAETAFLTFEACFPDSIVGFRAFDEAVTPAFVELFIKSARSKIDEFAPATAQKNINLTTLETLVIPFCGTAEQAEIVRVLDTSLEAAEALDKEIAANLARADALRQSILQRAFSGQLIPQNPSDEPASALLARIQAERDTVPPKRPKELTEA